MHDRFEPRERRRIVEHLGAKKAAVNNSIAHRSGKSSLDDGRRLARIKRMDHGIRVMNLYPLGAKHCGGRRLPHADRSGEAQNEHHVAAKISVSTKPRSSAVTRGFLPNQRSNPGTA